MWSKVSIWYRSHCGQSIPAEFSPKQDEQMSGREPGTSFLFFEEQLWGDSVGSAAPG